MVPTADLANHSFQHNSVYAFRASQGFFELKSSRAIKEGEAVCISYGQDKTNAELMRDYGFFVPGNPHDRLDFAVSGWQQHSPVIAKPAKLLFKALNGGAAPLTEEERPQLLAGPFLRAVGLTGKLKAGKVKLKLSAATIFSLLLALMYVLNGVYSVPQMYAAAIVLVHNWLKYSLWVGFEALCDLTVCMLDIAEDQLLVLHPCTTQAHCMS